LTKMENDNLIEQVISFSARIALAREEIEQKHDKFQVALTGVFRLLSEGKNPAIGRMQADPEQLKGYVIRLASQLRQDSLDICDTMKSGLASIIESARNP